MSLQQKYKILFTDLAEYDKTEICNARGSGIAAGNSFL